MFPSHNFLPGECEWIRPCSLGRQKCDKFLKAQRVPLYYQGCTPPCQFALAYGREDSDIFIYFYTSFPYAGGAGAAFPLLFLT